MKADPVFSDLIGRIYDCVLDADRWPGVLAEITDLLGGYAADMIVSHPLERRQHCVYVHNWPTDVLRTVEANSHLNPVLPLGLTAPLCEPFCTSRHLDVGAFHRSRYWQLCFAGRGVFDYLTVPITRTVSSFSSWGVVSGETKPAFTDDDLDLGRALSPHIKRSVEISGVLGHSRVEAGTLRAALDALAASALIIEPDGEILYCNQAAEVELSSALVLRAQNGRLLPTSREMGKLLDVLASAEQRRKSRGLDVHLTDEAGRALHVTWAALEQAGDELGSPILLLLREQEPVLSTPLSSASRMFKLTTAETQVLAQVLNGLTLNEAGAVLGIARSTVKTHLDAIYRKTHTHRQAELVRFVVGLSSPLQS